MRFFIGLSIVALALSFALPVCAETQSVKVSGDITMRGIWRESFDLQDNNYTNDSDNYFMTNTAVQVDADLTDNVSTCIRLLNMRDWNVGHTSYSPGDDLDGVSTFVRTDDEFDIVVDLAYLTLKEFFFAPLTVKIGRQDLWFGKGFIVGANKIDPHGTLSGDEWSEMDAFDAIRATWDFDPWTLDGIYAKVIEGNVMSEDDVDLWGLNLGCVLDYYNAEAELYWFYKRDRFIHNVNTASENEVHNFGVRGSFEPHQDITFWSEAALQLGSYVGPEIAIDKRDRLAGALDLGMECRLWQNQYAWKPKIGAEYVLFTGEDARTMTGNTNQYNGWDSMYRGRYFSSIQEWIGDGNLYETFSINAAANNFDQDSGKTNLHQFILSGSIEPMENLTLEGRYLNFWLMENGDNATVRAIGDEKHKGDELDLWLTYDYTEDVTFGLLSAWFFPGEYYKHLPTAINGLGDANIASEVVGTVKVSF